MALPELHPLRRPRTVAEACCLVADVGLLGVLWVAPLAMGGRFPVGRLLLVALIVLVAASWFSAKLFSERRVWRWSGAELLVGLAIALVLVSLDLNRHHRLRATVDELTRKWEQYQNIRLKDPDDEQRRSFELAASEWLESTLESLLDNAEHPMFSLRSLMLEDDRLITRRA